MMNTMEQNVKAINESLEAIENEMDMINESLEAIENELGVKPVNPVKVKMNKEGRVKMVMDTQHFVALTALLHRVRLGGDSYNSKIVFELLSEIEKFLPQYDLDHLVDDASDSIIAVTEDGSATIYDPVFEFNDYE